MHSKFLSDSNTFYRRYCPVLILLLGALLRLLYLSRVPGGLHQDEAFVLLNSYDLLHEGRDPQAMHSPSICPAGETGRVPCTPGFSLLSYC